MHGLEVMVNKNNKLSYVATLLRQKLERLAFANRALLPAVGMGSSHNGGAIHERGWASLRGLWVFDKSSRQSSQTSLPPSSAVRCRGTAGLAALHICVST